MMRAWILLGLLAGAARADRDLEVEGALGALTPEAVRREVSQHAAAFELCFRSQAEKMRHLGGAAHVKIRVARDGTVRRAHVDSGDLGSWPAERCILSQARKMSFGAPRGGEAEVLLPLEFIAWMPADAADGAELEAKLAKELGKCAGGPRAIDVTAYVGPGGRVKSAGFAGEVSEAWADCALKKALALRLRDPRGRMLKMTGRVRP
jgi:hypothetical protein